ncbi:MAG: proton-conducting transporter membrane subunit, partial [Candidatus Poribacteria bacterium]
MNGCPLALVACLLGVAAPVATAQRRERPRSPEVHDDRTVTFRLNAPNAAEVKLSASFVEGDDAVMQRDADGMWTLTVGPLEPEIYGYKLVVDDRATVDPLGHDGRLGPWPETLFLIRDATPRAYELQGAPQGVVHIHRYTSTSLAMERRLHVYTPPGYTPETAYPVVYLLHGFGDDDAAWMNMGRANIIADNLLLLFVFWELVGLTSYLLIGFWFHRPAATAAAKKAFLMTRFGDLGLLAALLLIWDRTGTLNIAEINTEVVELVGL